MKDSSSPDSCLDLIARAMQDKDADKAITLCREGLTLYPENIGLLQQYGKLCFQHHDLAASEAAFRQILASVPDNAQALINLGLVLKTTARLDEAEHCYRQAIALETCPAPIQAQAHFNLAILLLTQEKWREGFAAYEWRHKKPGAIACPYPLPLWTPDMPAGSRILLWNDQGFGDAVMFVRFTKTLADKGYRLFLFGQKSLKALAKLAPFIEGALDPLDRPPALDACLPLCSLPYALNLDQIEPWSAPYLQAPPTSAYPFADKPAGRRRVGIVWAGNPAHRNNDHRSLKLAELMPLFDVPNVDWFSLQMGHEEELAALRGTAPVQDMSPSIRDFADTASIMAKLDLLISVDTAAAHVGAALGLPVWTLLPAVGGDWRWKTAGETTVWYPSMRLFRQKQAGDWAPVIAEVAKALFA